MSKTNTSYSEACVLTDGLVVVPITFRVLDSGQKLFSFAFLRTYTTRGSTERTPWLFRKHIGAVRALLDQLEHALTAEEQRAQEDSPHT
jgi:hypothetical protein